MIKLKKTLAVIFPTLAIGASMAEASSDAFARCNDSCQSSPSSPSYNSYWSYDGSGDLYDSHGGFRFESGRFEFQGDHRIARK